MALPNGAAWVILVGLAFMAVHCVSAKQFVVGGAAGWTLPSFGNISYASWNAGNKYHVGDSLLFNYSKEFHNVLVVSKVDYASCSSVNPIATFQDGHTIISLSSIGNHYYICGVPGHCTEGQKLMVKVRAAASSSNSTAPAHLAPKHAPAPGPRSYATSTSILTWTYTFALVLSLMMY